MNLSATHRPRAYSAKPVDVSFSEVGNGKQRLSNSKMKAIIKCALEGLVPHVAWIPYCSVRVTVLAAI
jgi:hypothetical protein